MRPSFLITAWLLWFVAHASRMVIPPVLPLIKEELGISHAQAGQIFTYLTLGYCGALLTVPFWSRVPGYRRTLNISLAGLTLTLFLMRWATGLGAISALAFCIGLATGTILPSAIPLITTAYGKEQWTQSLSIFNSAAPTGQFFAPMLAIAVLSMVPWRYLFWAMAAVSAIVMLMFQKSAPVEDPPADKPQGSIAAVIRDPNMITLGILWTLASAAGAGLGFLTPVYLVEERGMDLAVANPIFAAGRGANVIGAIYAGYLTERFTCRSLLGWIMALTGVAQLGIALWPENIGVSVWVFLEPFINLMFFPVGFILMARITTEGVRGAAVGLVIGVGTALGFGVTPWVLGAIADVSSFQAGIAGLGVITVLSSLAVLRLEPL